MKYFTIKDEILETLLFDIDSVQKAKNNRDIIIENIERQLKKLYPENPIDSQYKTGYYNAICDVMRLIKNDY